MNNYIYQSKIKNHSEIKTTLLNQINLIPNNPVNDSKCKLFHTDWNLPVEMHREYKFLFFESVKDHLNKISLDLSGVDIEITNFWFQQYTDNGLHSWHTHAGSHFSNVYFLECPDGYSTEFKNFKCVCEEGDILSFPAFLPHRSPLLKNNNRKTIIAFNIIANYPE
jgi:hypothetical protein|tara:strand:+ start:5167 stop:5664 length:498 start_codon:yes stop_codon:yes gene_type:complete